MVDDGSESPISPRTKLEVLGRLRPIPNRRKHVIPRKHQFHRPADVARSKRGQDCVRPDRSLGAERAADEWTDHPDLVERQPNRLRQTLPRHVDGLSGVEHSQFAAGIPHGYRRVRLHRIVVLDWRRIRLFDTDFGLRQGTHRIAARVVRLNAAHRLMRVRLSYVCVELGSRSLRLVFHVDQPGGELRLLQRLSHKQCDVLAGVVDDLALQGHDRLDGYASWADGGLQPRYLWRVLVRHHAQHAGCCLGSGRVQSRDATTCDRALDQRGVCHVFHLELAGICRRSGDFQPPIHAVQWCADN